MTGILPNNGVPPSQTTNGIQAPDLAGDCENLYYGPRCNPRLDPFAMNALISEVINALNAIGQAYDCTRLDNLAAAFQTLQGGSEVQPSGAPAAILQNNMPSGQAIPNFTAGVWNTRPTNTKAYDPGSIVALAADQFTPNVDCYCTYDGLLFQGLRAMDRIWNVTDGTVAGSGLSQYVDWDGPVAYNITSSGYAFLTAGKTYRHEVFVQTTGISYRPASSGMPELSSIIRLWRLPPPVGP